MTKLDDDPTRIHGNPDTTQAIINTLTKCASAGLDTATIKSVSDTLRQLSCHADLFKPEQVKTYIATATNIKKETPLSNATKQKLINNYNYFVMTHGLEWGTRPKYKAKETIPLIPSTDNVNKIISASSKKYATIFTILAETGLESFELSSTTRQHINTEDGTISAIGCKGHNPRAFKLRTRTAEMLRLCIHKHTDEHPFPKPKDIGEQWRTYRNRTADKLNQPELKNIQMRNLRNYSGAQIYYRTQDPIQTMRHLRHKKLETTMHYLRAITIGGDEEYVCKAATTADEAKQLIENGFTYVQTIDNIHLYRKRK